MLVILYSYDIYFYVKFMSILKFLQIYLFCVLEEFGLNDIVVEWEFVFCIFYVLFEVLEF